MKNFFSFLGASCVLSLTLFCGSTTATAQQATARVLHADINGNQIHMYLDHDSLQSLINRTMAAMDTNEDGSLLEWNDVLTNGNNPGINVNYNGFSVYGIDSLTSTGLLTADSLKLLKDAEIAKKLNVGDSLVVAGAAAFTGDVKGPRSTGDDEFVTYGQLDSIANTAPFNETYKVFKLSGAPATQTIAGTAYPGTTDRLLLLNDGGIYGYFTELSNAAQYPADPADQPFVIVTAPDHHMDLTDKGVYQFFITLEVKNTTTTDAFVTVEIQNYDADETFFTNTRTLSSESEVVYGTNSFGAGVGVGLSHHLNSGMSFECDHNNEDIQVEITVLPAGASIDIVSMSLSVSRVGEE